jgi:tetratricopeptide (TPR) repeat protein
MRGDYETGEKNSVYHYKNILYSYAFNIDSAAYYFDLMRQAGRLPHNNYANFRGICGDFKTAEEEYKLASEQDAGDKRLQEWAYFSSIIDIYKGKPKAGAGLADAMIKSAGSTPGYGWYNIARARCLLYDGQVAEAQKYADRAAEFKEVHIGTTLGQSHYDFSIQLLKLINKVQSWQMDRFEHSNWWYNPAVLYSMAGKQAEKYLQQFLIINQFAQNPERERVIYKLFSTESTVSWDEIWYLVHDFSNQYFIDRFQKEAQTDNRAYIRKYFELFVARLKMQQGKYAEAKPMLDKILVDPNTDAAYEKLFTARVYQAQAECAKAQHNEAAQNDWLYRMYILYPQLVPYTDMPMNMNLHISGDVDAAAEKRLRDCNIRWVTNSSVPAAEAYVIFTKNGTKKDITYYVLDRRGNYIVQKQSFAWQKADEAGTALAYRLFNIGGKEETDDDTKDAAL